KRGSKGHRGRNGRISKAIRGRMRPTVHEHSLRRESEMEDTRFLHRQANRCYQLAWQSFDLRVAQKLNLLGLNLLGNEHTAKARELRSQKSKRDAKLVDPGSTR